MLEGDDQFLSSHLQEAYNILSANPTVGIYAVGNQGHDRPVLGFIDSKTYFRQTYSMQDVSPPSETIFVRECYSKLYFYNSADYVYCPEVDLYLNISNDGFDVFHSPLRTVIRDISSKDKTYWRFLKDQFTVIKKFQNHSWINTSLYHQTLTYYANIAFDRYLLAKVKKNPEAKQIWYGVELEIVQVIPEHYLYLHRTKRLLDLLVKVKIINPHSVKCLSIIKFFLKQK